MPPKVTIVIPFYNDPYIEMAIVSALGQTYPNVEIIVIDDGSAVHAERIHPFMTRVRYVSKANGGTASALNHGIRLATGEYIAWLSSDDMYYPDKLQCQIRFMLDRNALISFTSFDQINANNDITQRSIGPQLGSLDEIPRILLGSNPINGCTVIGRRDLFLQVGLFNEGLPYTHDYDLWIRMVLSGVRFHYLNYPTIMYRWHERMGTVRHSQAIRQEIATVQAAYRGQLHALTSG